MAEGSGLLNCTPLLAGVQGLIQGERLGSLRGRSELRNGGKLGEIWRTRKIDTVRERAHRTKKDRAVHREHPLVPGSRGHSMEISFPLAAIAVTTTKSTLDQSGQAT